MDTMTTIHITIKNDLDIISARLRVREVAREMGFNTIDQARISLATSELARTLAQNAKFLLEIIVSSIQDKDLSGIQVTSTLRNRSTHAMSTQDNDSISKVMALVDEGNIDKDAEHNIRVTLKKWLV